MAKLELNTSTFHRAVSQRSVASHMSQATGLSPRVGETSAPLNSYMVRSHRPSQASLEGLRSMQSVNDYFLKEAEDAHALGFQLRELLEQADSSKLAQCHALAETGGMQELRNCYAPRICWQIDADESGPKRQLRRPSATASQSRIMSPEKGQSHIFCGCVGMAPDRAFRRNWDLFQILVLLAETILFPLQALVDDPTFGRGALQLLFPIYWSIDILVSFWTGFYSMGQLVVDSWRIAKNYARSWLLFDLAYVLVDFIVIFSESRRTWPRELTSIALLHFFQMGLRIVRLLRLGKLLESFKKEMVSDVSLAKANVGQIGLQIMLIHHIMACGWYYLGTMNKEGWIAIAGTTDRSKLYLYTTSLHWMFCQLGFGGTEIEPNTSAERFYGLLVNFSALVIFSTLLGTVTNLAASLNRSSEERRFLFANLGRFLKYNQIQKDLSARITHFLQHAYAVKQLHINEVGMALPVAVGFVNFLWLSFLSWDMDGRDKTLKSSSEGARLGILRF